MKNQKQEKNQNQYYQICGAEKRTNSDYNKEEYLTKKIEEQGMIVNEDIVIVDGWQFSINRDIPKIEESFGKIEINDIGTTIGSHTGPGTVALFFWGKERID